jgi:hypothetical protein
MNIYLFRKSSFVLSTADSFLCIMKEEIGSSHWSETRIWDAWNVSAINAFPINIMNTTPFRHETLFTMSGNIKDFSVLLSQTWVSA